MSKIIEINPWSNKEYLYTKNVSCLYGHHVSGFIDIGYSEASPMNDVKFVCNTLVGLVGDQPYNTNIMRDGSVIHLSTIDNIIEELLLLRDHMRSVQVANQLEKV